MFISQLEKHWYDSSLSSLSDFVCQFSWFSSLVLLVLLGVIYRLYEFSQLSVLHNQRNVLRLSCIHLDNGRLCNKIQNSF